MPTSAPWAAATPSATRRTPSSIRSRVASDTVRTVPSRLAVSGITLRVVPASIRAIVSTAGAKKVTRRPTRRRVAGPARLDPGDREHRGVEDVHAPRDQRLEGLHDLARDRNRVTRRVNVFD